MQFKSPIRFLLLLLALAVLECPLLTAGRIAQPVQVYYNLGTMAQNFRNASQAIASGDYEAAAALIARSGGMIPGTLAAMRETARLEAVPKAVSP